jgi:hypothetical protein
VGRVECRRKRGGSSFEMYIRASQRHLEQENKTGVDAGSLILVQFICHDSEVVEMEWRNMKVRFIRGGKRLAKYRGSRGYASAMSHHIHSFKCRNGQKRLKTGL